MKINPDYISLWSIIAAITIICSVMVICGYVWFAVLFGFLCFLGVNMKAECDIKPDEVEEKE